MHSSASRWRRLAWLAVLGVFPLACATTPKAPATYVVRYEVTGATYITARHQAGIAGDTLAERLGRHLVVKSSTFDRFRVILEDDQVADPISRVNVLVAHAEGTAWSVSVFKGAPGEDERVRAIRSRIEQALRSMGVRWTSNASDQDLRD
jgi:hypothetical protein